MIDHERVHGRDDVINHDTPSSRQGFRLSTGVWLDNIEKPKEKKRQNEGYRFQGDSQARYHHPHDLVNHHKGWIFAAMSDLVVGYLSDPDHEKDSGQDNIRNRELSQDYVKRDSPKGSGGAGCYGRGASIERRDKQVTQGVLLNR